MQQSPLPSAALVCFLAAGVIFWPSCRGGTAAATELPSPQNDDRPPGSPPELPRTIFELPADNTTAAPVRVLSEGDNLEDALDDAKPGDVIALTPGAVFRGAFKLPNKPGAAWITIRTNTGDGVFPRRGTRVQPAQAPLMAVIESESSDSVLTTAAGAHHYRFIGIEFRPMPGAFVHNLIQLGEEDVSVETTPHHIVFERCYIHGDPKVGGRRGIALNSRNTAVVDSYISDFKEQGNDSQAVAGWNGAGPFLIENNYLEAAGENLMFGGADPMVKNLVPSDIVVRANHFAKPLRWRRGNPAFEGTEWAVKNLFELKNARRVLVENNVLEYNWQHAQNAFAVLFTPRNQEGTAPWSLVWDVTFTRNIVRHSGAGVNILGRDDNHPSQQTKRILIRNNVFEDIDSRKWGGSGRLFQVMSGTADIIIEHNTGFHTGDVIAAEGEPNLGFAYRNNLTPHNEYGVGGSGTYGRPRETLARYFPDAVFAGNVLIGGPAHLYPPGNFFPESLAEVQFVNAAAGDYRLAASSPFKGVATDGKDVGADLTGSDAQKSRRRAARKTD